MKKTIALAVIAAVLMTGCATVQKPPMQAENYSSFAFYSVIVPECAKLGYINENDVFQNRMNINYLMNTWNYDQATFNSYVASAKADTTPIDSILCNNYKIGIAEMKANAEIHRNQVRKIEAQRERDRARTAAAVDAWNRSIQANKPTYCTHNVIGNSIYSTCN
ncbi:hypothetical protein [Vibrio mediterranei]|uniref:hypothetical protein n=1 Tax=Vibrio mediterranei TaxID=689 RepID=UPI001EFD3A8D|nr:hypothetical protein [Vibrio mediterranei]MCG9660868.1 hypothetical protein [Vibrio mediterranei]